MTPVRSRLAAVVLVLLGMTVTVTAVEPPDQKLGNPRLRAALYELQEARKELLAAEGDWPKEKRDPALESTQEAIDTVRILLAVKDLNDVGEPKREADYYKQFADHPRLRAALIALRDARAELREHLSSKLRDEAMDDIDVAVGDIVTLLRDYPERKKK